MSEPKMPTSSEEMAKIAKSRTESDAELLKGGAEYVVDKKGDARLDVTARQKEKTVIEAVEKNSEQIKKNLDELSEVVSYKKYNLEYYRRTDGDTGGPMVPGRSVSSLMSDFENTTKEVDENLRQVIAKKIELKKQVKELEDATDYYINSMEETIDSVRSTLEERYGQ